MSQAAKAEILEEAPATPDDVAEEMASRKIKSAVEPPVEDTQTGLTRAQIAAELPNVVVESAKPAPVGADETERPVFEPTVHEYVYEGQREPAPMGVPQNLWDMTYEANNSTDSRDDNSRAWWKQYCGKLHTEYMEKQAA
jgi:hypothetical protein